MKKVEETTYGKIARELLARVTSDHLIGKRIKNGELRKHAGEVEAPWKVPEGYTLLVIDADGHQMELLRPDQVNDKIVVLQLHGGGYIGAMKNIYRSFAGLYSELGKGICVLTPDYRVAPEHPYPAALEDAIFAYHRLIGEGWRPDQIVLAGDSAGGGLALALCLWLKEKQEPLPAGIVAMSPYTDMTHSGESYKTNYTLDPLFGNTMDSLIYNTDYLQGHDPFDPYVSPLYGNYEGMPPMLVQVGGYEMLLSDSELMVEKAKAAGVKVRFSVYEGMFHVFQMALLLLPESRRAWHEVGRFLEIMMDPEKNLETEGERRRTRQLMADCTLCPRACHADRLHGEVGFCGQTDQIRAARAALHMWEEPCISGDAGSGTVFFSGCTLRCVYCQNERIAGGNIGKEITIERLAEIFMELQQQGAWNINLVTPTHFVPQIVQALRLAKIRGLHLPIVYNTSGYEKVETLRMLDGLVDIYLPDFKYLDEEIAGRYSAAPDYPEVAMAAIAEMVRQTGPCEFDGERMVRGVIVRHLVLPELQEMSKRIIRYLHQEYGDTIFVSIMNQYTPLSEQLGKYPELRRKLTIQEYEDVVDDAIEIGVENGFIQEGQTAEESFIPDFDITGI